ncbi:hypothetical protein KGD83_12240 [Nocardiopsis akebiae]|uniref:Uncharacterized protein n=1 Tax=Nocardiopsis akebiae TaxID=2831968 RepID=A0ABX8C9U5_9ACTN|nr:hypothetical protein [Nocardiopsis akebiae]QUX31187.1 hypothetical protein KGD83_12240 [Nocardiopsis akebiae]
MTETRTVTESGPLALARMHALGTAPIRADLPDAIIVDEALRAGRSVLDVVRWDEPARILGWVEGHEPSHEEKTGLDHPQHSRTDLEVFAACLGCCWRDRHAEPWPGVPCEQQEVLDALAWVKEDDSSRALGRSRRALARLDRSLWVELSGTGVRLGPRVATWSRSQTIDLREVFDLLPRHPESPPLEEPR